MYVRTEPVHTYIAKTPKRTICAILYDPKVVPVNLTGTTQVLSSCHGGNSVLMVLDKMSTFFLSDKLFGSAFALIPIPVIKWSK